MAVALLSAGLILGGCGVPGQPGSAPTESDPVVADAPSTSGSTLQELLDGREFETSGPGDVRGFDLVAGSALTLSFGPDADGNPWMGATAGCNGAGAAVDWDGDAVRPRAEGLGQTEMACDGLMEQEAWFFDLVAGGLSLTLDDVFLTASNADGSVEIVLTDAAVLHPDMPLVGQTWRLTGMTQNMAGGGMAESSPGELTASLTITRDPSDGHLRLDVFDGLTWMSVPGGFDGATGVYVGTVTMEPTRFADAYTDLDEELAVLDATAGTVRVSGGLAGDSIGCAGDDSDCRVAEMRLLGRDFEFATHRETLTVTGLGEFDGLGLTFVFDPAAPAPNLDEYQPEDSNPLLGRTIELTRTFTDAGGVDRLHDDARLLLTFGPDSVTADGSCGPFTYDDVQYITDPVDTVSLGSVDLGEPSITGCVLGEDPVGPPSGRLMFGASTDAGVDGEMWLSTGFVAWYFVPVE